jgi:hypothetical protein
MTWRGRFRGPLSIEYLNQHHSYFRLDKWRDGRTVTLSKAVDKQSAEDGMPLRAVAAQLPEIASADVTKRPVRRAAVECAGKFLSADQ